MPKKFNIHKKINWKINNQTIIIHIVGNLSFKKKTNFYHSDNKSHISEICNKKILKSNLQKCIRRKLIVNSIHCAFQFLELYYIDFLRRLSIIMIEDVLLHHSFTIIMWLIAAYPNYQPSTEINNYLLGVVHFLATCKFRETFKKKSQNQIHTYFIQIETIKDINIKSLLYSLLFRISFGGLYGDKILIHTILQNYIKFINQNNLKNKYLNHNLKLIQINTKMNINHIHKSCIDYHIFPIIINQINIKFPSLNHEVIKKNIWVFRSSINYRDDLQNYNCINERINNNNFLLFSKYLDQLSYYYIRNFSLKL